MTEILYDVIIIGSGPAGFSAAIYAVRSGRKTLLLSGVRWGGQLMLTTLVENSGRNTGAGTYDEYAKTDGKIGC